MDVALIKFQGIVKSKVVSGQSGEGDIKSLRKKIRHKLEITEN